MKQPYYCLNRMHRILTMFCQERGEHVEYHLDPRIEYKVNILWQMPNGTTCIEIPDYDWKGMVSDTKAIHLSSYDLLYDGRYNGDPQHGYWIRRELAVLSIYTEEGKWITLANPPRCPLKILERVNNATKVDSETIKGWMRGISDIEIGNFNKFFDGRFNTAP